MTDDIEKKILDAVSRGMDKVGNIGIRLGKTEVRADTDPVLRATWEFLQYMIETESYNTTMLHGLQTVLENSVEACRVKREMG